MDYCRRPHSSSSRPSSAPRTVQAAPEPLASWSRTRNARIQYSRLVPPPAPLTVSTGASSPTRPNMASLLQPSTAVWPAPTSVQQAAWRPPASDAGSSNCTTAVSDEPSEMEVEGEYMLQHQEAMQRRLHTPRSRFHPVGKRSSMATNSAVASYERFMQNVSAYTNSSSGSSSSSNSPRAFAGLAVGAAPAPAAKPSAVVASGANHDDEDTRIGGPGPERMMPTVAPTSVAKSSRYLREIDRRAILARIESGEKQSELAKEYQVSRAAICNLNKHREEVFARKDGNPLAKHPKKPRPKTPKPTVAGMPSSMKWSSSGNNRYSYVLGNGGGSSLERSKLGVHEMKSRAVALLLTTLRKKFTTPIEFRRVSERLMRLLLEEALALVPIRRVDIVIYEQRREAGVVMEHPPCAISMEQDGCPMLELFHEMEPEQPTGYICFDSPEDKSQSDDASATTLSLLDAHLPASLSYHNVFLLAHVASSGERLCAAVHCLLERGASKAMVSIVSLVASTDAVQQLHAQHPDVKLLAAQIVSDSDGREGDAATDATATGAQSSNSSNGKPSQTSLMRLRLEEAYQSTTC
jgi:uracil phosphoribosyltransferase